MLCGFSFPFEIIVAFIPPQCIQVPCMFFTSERNLSGVGVHIQVYDLDYLRLSQKMQIYLCIS